MEKINERIYEANIELVDRNKLLEEDVKKLEKRIEKAIEYIMSELITEYDIKYGGNVSGSDLPVEAIKPILEILKGEEYGNNWENSSN